MAQDPVPVRRLGARVCWVWDGTHIVTMSRVLWPNAGLRMATTIAAVAQSVMWRIVGEGGVVDPTMRAQQFHSSLPAC